MTARSQIKRHPERAVPDETSDILLEGTVAHVGFADEDGPVVIPLLYGFSSSEPDRIIFPGSRASRLQNVLASGAPVCGSVTLLDGLVYSRSAKFHSANYRSVTWFGRAREITDVAAKQSAMADMTARYFTGRTSGSDYQPPTERELDEIRVVELLIEESSAKARRGGPKGAKDKDDSAAGSSSIAPVGR